MPSIINNKEVNKKYGRKKKKESNKKEKGNKKEENNKEEEKIAFLNDGGFAALNGVKSSQYNW